MSTKTNEVAERVAAIQEIARENFDEAVEIRGVIEIIQTQNSGGVNAKLAGAGASNAGFAVRNALFARGLHPVWMTPS